MTFPEDIGEMSYFISIIQNPKADFSPASVSI